MIVYNNIVVHAGRMDVDWMVVLGWLGMVWKPSIRLWSIVRIVSGSLGLPWPFPSFSAFLPEKAMVVGGYPCFERQLLFQSNGACIVFVHLVDSGG